jgi:hypothetical protein
MWRSIAPEVLRLAPIALQTVNRSWPDGAAWPSGTPEILEVVVVALGIGTIPFSNPVCAQLSPPCGATQIRFRGLLKGGARLRWEHIAVQRIIREQAAPLRGFAG